MHSTSAITIPEPLHDVFGERQSKLELGLILFLGASVSAAVIALSPSVGPELPVWRKALAWVIFADVVAGAFANFSRGTSAYYAARPRNRWIFIAIHVHLLAIAWLLQAPMLPALGCWAYTMVAASITNLLIGHAHQKFVGAALMGIGLLGLVMMPVASPFMVAASLLFLVKVAFSFAVDHYEDAPGGQR